MLIEIFATALLTAQAADEPSGRWVHGRIRRIEGKVKRVQPEITEMPVLRPRSVNGPSVIFTCEEGRYRAFVSLRDNNHYAGFLGSDWDRIRNASVSISVGGEESWRGRAWYRPDLDLVELRKRQPAAQIVNAIIRKQTVSFSMQSEDHNLSLPPVDDPLRDFAEECKDLAEAD